MTIATYRTPQKTAELGFRALVDKLGPGGAVAFLHQYESGEGNYTVERKAILARFKLENLQKRKGVAKLNHGLSRKTNGH